MITVAVGSPLQDEGLSQLPSGFSVRFHSPLVHSTGPYNNIFPPVSHGFIVLYWVATK